jgi:hypothetical protein
MNRTMPFDHAAKAGGNRSFSLMFNGVRSDYTISLIS